MDLKKIKGLGPSRIKILEEHGIMQVEDLLLHFPHFYYDLDHPECFAEDGRYKLIKASVISEIKVVRIRGNFSYSMCECLDENNNKFKAIWYNQTFLKNAIKNNDVLYLYGKNSATKKNYFVVSTYKNANKLLSSSGLLPVYKTFKNVGQSVLSSAIKSASELCEIQSIIPKTIEKEFLTDYDKAIKTIHYPQNQNELNTAKERINIDKIMPFIKFNHELELKKNTLKTQNYTNFDQVMSKFCSFLPYTLTTSQREVLQDIKKDMMQKKPINRLIQGDVGSGKTVVALITCAVCVASGSTAILVAPTEILAKQHFEEAKKYFQKLELQTMFLSSSSSKEERARIQTNLKFKIPFLLVGTQACLSDEIQGENISMIIIDEQHRFGVGQRTKLLNKAQNAHLIMLSATPIPRSLSIVYYGGMDISKLEKPPKEKQIQTNIVSSAKENELWNFVQSKIQEKSKAYVVCANIDEGDDDAYQGLSAKEVYKNLCNKFDSKIVRLAHGKLSQTEEENILNDFRKDEARILVSTTIIEVGIDIKDADIIIIVSPEKFGLATLHQLRGRVGRAGQQSFCFCLSRNLNEISYQRIKFFKEHLNGFEIAEFDYENRGAGSIYSLKQHGKIENMFDYISLTTFEKAKEIYERISEKYDTDFLLKTPQYEQLSQITFN